MGTLVPLRVFGNAVERNYARRRLREYYRLNKELFPDRFSTLIRLYKRPDDWSYFLRQLQRLLSIAREKAARMERR